nr:hypothetical protein [Tanacetum cinerariifolium]
METLTVESPIHTVSSQVPTACLNDSLEPSSEAILISKRVANQEETPSLDNILLLANRFEYILGVTTSSDEIIGVDADVSNIETSISASLTPTLRIHKDHPKSQIIGPVDTLIQTRHKSKMMEEQSFIATIHQKTDPTFLQFCLFSCFLSQVEPKKNVWTLVDCPKGVRPIGTKWVLKNKRDERGIVVHNKAKLVAQGHTQEERIDYNEVFAPVARIEAIRLFLAYASFMGFTIYQMDVKSAFLYSTIDEEEELLQFKMQKVWVLVDLPNRKRAIVARIEAIRLFLAYASFMGFMVYQMDVKSAFLYGTLKEEVYVCQPPGFEDPNYPNKVYKVVKALYGLHQALRA